MFILRQVEVSAYVVVLAPDDAGGKSVGFGEKLLP